MRLPRAVLAIVTIALPLVALAVPAAAAVSTDATVAPDGSTAKTVYVIAYRDRCDGGVDVGLANAAAVGSAPIPFSINGETVVNTGSLRTPSVDGTFEGLFRPRLWGPEPWTSRTGTVRLLKRKSQSKPSPPCKRSLCA